MSPKGGLTPQSWLTLSGPFSKMGWKCPACGTHNYKNGKCRGCSPKECDICNGMASNVDAIHPHHTSYKKNTVIPVCKSCHAKIHLTDQLEEYKPDLGREEAIKLGVYRPAIP